MREANVCWVVRRPSLAPQGTCSSPSAPPAPSLNPMERVFLLPAYCIAAEVRVDVKHAARSCTHGNTCYFLYFITKCILLILIYRGKNIIVQLQNAKVSATKLCYCGMAGLLMAGRKRTCYFDSVTNSVFHS